MSLLIAQIIFVALLDLIVVTRLLRFMERFEPMLPRSAVRDFLRLSTSLRVVR